MNFFVSCLILPSIIELSLKSLGFILVTFIKTIHATCLFCVSRFCVFPFNLFSTFCDLVATLVFVKCSLFYFFIERLNILICGWTIHCNIPSYIKKYLNFTLLDVQGKHIDSMVLSSYENDLDIMLFYHLFISLLSKVPPCFIYFHLLIISCYKMYLFFYCTIFYSSLVIKLLWVTLLEIPHRLKIKPFNSL